MKPHPRKATRRDSALDAKSPRDQEVADPIAQVPLQLDALAGYASAGAARLLQVLREILQKRLVVRKAEDDGDGLPPASRALHAQLGDRAHGHRLGGRRSTA